MGCRGEMLGRCSEDREVGEQMETEQQRLVKEIATILKKTLTEEKGSMKRVEEDAFPFLILVGRDYTEINITG